MPKSACPRGRGGGERALRPARRLRDRGLDDGARRLARRAHVELHLDVGADQPLDAHGLLGREVMLRSVEVRPEREALLGGARRATRLLARRACAPSENAWKPPESVSIACGQRVKRVQARRARAIASRRRGAAIRWYVLPRTMRAPVAATSVRGRGSSRSPASRRA